MEPVAQVDVAGRLIQRIIQNNVPVSEHQVIKIFLPEHLPGVLYQHLIFLTPDIIGCCMVITAAQRPFMGKSDSEVGVNTGKHPLCEGIMKDLLQQFERSIARPQAITMGQVKLLARNIYTIGLPVNHHTHFVGQIVKNPQVVITCKKMHGDTLIGKLSYLSQEANKAFGNRLFVLKTKIKHVPQQVQSGRMGPNLVEPLHQVFLPGKAGIM